MDSNEGLKNELTELLGVKRAYLGFQAEIDSAQVVILPVPYDSTTSYGVGTRFGPAAIIDASTQLELYDIELEMNICEKVSVHTLDELAIHKGDPVKMMERIAAAVDKIVRLGKKPVVFGGEHSITPGVIAGLAAKHDLSKLSILQFDAHSDLREQFDGTKQSHASALKRVRDLVGGAVVQVGIRSMCDDEAAYIKKQKIEDSIFYAHKLDDKRKNGKLDPKDVSSIIEQLGDEVYVTFDIDCLDPSVIPGTGTPEPGGLLWKDVLQILSEVGKKRKVIGFDINEVLPVPPLKTSEFAAAKLSYKMMGYFWAKK